MDNNYVGHQNNYRHRVSTNTRTTNKMMRDETICNNNKYLCHWSPEYLL